MEYHEQQLLNRTRQSISFRAMASRETWKQTNQIKLCFIRFIVEFDE